MPFTTRHSGQAAIATGHTAGPGSQRIASLASLLFCVALISGLIAQPVHAQSVAQPATVPAPANNAQGHASDTEDPVARFLADKGLMPSKRPVAELAQQMRDTASDIASDLVLSAMNFLGVPYRRGGSSSETGFDCSGFTRHVFENSVGLILPRRAIEQANSPALMPVQQAELKPGDLVFFNTLRHTFSHVGIYIGDNKFIHSPRAGGQVRVEDMRQAYWQQRYDGARRAPAISAQSTAAARNN